VFINMHQVSGGNVAEICIKFTKIYACINLLQLLGAGRPTCLCVRFMFLHNHAYACFMFRQAPATTCMYNIASRSYFFITEFLI
jgi:hypothetical protein